MAGDGRTLRELVHELKIKGPVYRRTVQTTLKAPLEENVPAHRDATGDWSDLVHRTDTHGRQPVALMVYEVVTFQALREQLRGKEIWVVGADSWRNPDEDLPADLGNYVDTRGQSEIGFGITRRSASTCCHGSNRSTGSACTGQPDAHPHLPPALTRPSDGTWSSRATTR